MTIVYKTNTYIDETGQKVFVEQYIERGIAKKMYRYGYLEKHTGLGRIKSSLLWNYPSKRILRNIFGSQILTLIR